MTSKWIICRVALAAMLLLICSPDLLAVQAKTVLKTGRVVNIARRSSSSSSKKKVPIDSFSTPTYKQINRKSTGSAAKIKKKSYFSASRIWVILKLFFTSLLDPSNTGYDVDSSSIQEGSTKRSSRYVNILSV
jgi:hypothetical protein